MSRTISVPDDFIFPVCSKCGGYVSGIFTTNKVVCLDCGQKFKVDETIQIAGCYWS